MEREPEPRPEPEPEQDGGIDGAECEPEGDGGMDGVECEPEGRASEEEGDGDGNMRSAQKTQRDDPKRFQRLMAQLIVIMALYHFPVKEPCFKEGTYGRNKISVRARFCTGCGKALKALPEGDATLLGLVSFLCRCRALLEESRRHVMPGQGKAAACGADGKTLLPHLTRKQPRPTEDYLCVVDHDMDSRVGCVVVSLSKCDQSNLSQPSHFLRMYRAHGERNCEWCA